MNEIERQELRKPAAEEIFFIRICHSRIEIINENYGFVNETEIWKCSRRRIVLRYLYSDTQKINFGGALALAAPPVYATALLSVTEDFDHRAPLGRVNSDPPWLFFPSRQGGSAW